MSTGETSGTVILDASQDTYTLILEKVVVNSATLTRSDMFALGLAFALMLVAILAIITYLKGNNYTLDDVMHFIFIGLPKWIYTLGYSFLTVIFVFLLYCLSLGLVNMEIEIEALGKGRIPAWPKLLVRSLKFLSHAFAESIDMFVRIIAIIIKDTYKCIIIPFYRLILKPISLLIAAIICVTALNIAKIFNKAWISMIEQNMQIAKAHMRNGGWE